MRATEGVEARRTSLDSKEQLSARVAAYVREGIMVGEFRPDEYVRTERLASDLGVSPTPVREALMVLGSEGTVRWEPRKGYRVVPITPRDVQDLFLVQAFMAGSLAARAAVRLDEDELSRLEAVLVRLDEAQRRGDVELVDELNHEVHRTINKASGSYRLATLLNSTVHYVPLRLFGTIDGWSSASAHDHSAVLAAMRARDPDAAREAMSEHIQNIGCLLVAHVESRNLLSVSG